MWIKKLDSAWGVLLPCAVMPLLIHMDFSFAWWRIFMTAALVLTTLMLFHPRLRHYMLLPSCVALAGGLTSIVVNFNGL
ncbi:DUF1435 domain-containing protein [Paramixta manurensis]|uniref:DUF1435 domain-containing protein n=1 Tax=Paramixta manurensis TaxID=2740817 RepID=A0A6M8U4V0_9GAMM|nr:DUF1435 domain-containing protein [Erwiniaceae bacterium PD-1]